MIAILKRRKNKDYYETSKKSKRNEDVGTSGSLLTKLKKFVSIAIFCTFIFFAGRLFLHQQQQLDSLNIQKSELEDSIREIQERTRTLQEEIVRLHDKDYIEQIARNEYGMVGEDDIVFVPARGMGE